MGSTLELKFYKLMWSRAKLSHRANLLKERPFLICSALNITIVAVQAHIRQKEK